MEKVMEKLTLTKTDLFTFQLPPHGINFDQKGNLLMTEFNRYGRVMRFDIKQQAEQK